MGGLASKLENLFKSFEAEPVRILMLGLDCAGKTTILYQLKLGQIVKTIPTIGFNVETITPCKGLTLTVWDVGGQTKLRTLWKHYYQGAGGLIFVVDSADPSRFKEAKDELFGILNNSEMLRVPILVLANKQDIECSQSIDTVVNQLQLADIAECHKWSIQPCSATKNEGIAEGLQSFSRMVKEHRKENKP